MIPKIIHYVWLGGGEPSETIKRCIKSWKAVLPDYQIMRWDESTYDINSAPRFVKECYEAKKWAFASDYIRLWALYKFGGIYLDTDVEVRKTLNSFLDTRMFIGTQTFWVDVTKSKKELHTNLSIGVVGSEPNHPYLFDCIKYYDKTSILNSDGKINTTVSNFKMAELLACYGYKNVDERQHLAEGIDVFTTAEFGDRLSPTPDKDCYTYHWGEMSWFVPSHRGLLFRLCYQLGLMSLYRFVESTRKRLSSK